MTDSVCHATETKSVYAVLYLNLNERLFVQYALPRYFLIHLSLLRN